MVQDGPIGPIGHHVQKLVETTQREAKLENVLTKRINKLIGKQELINNII